jgi:ketosteroid isomerase-like protein
MTTLEQRLDELTRRVQALEDELAIHRLIVRYGLAVDVGDADAAAATFAEDGIYDVDVGVMRGREAVAAMVRGERHQAMVGRCAHQIGPAVVEIAGERATAVGYSRVYLATEGGVDVYRVSTNRWHLARQHGGWAIVRRVTRLLGHKEALRPFSPPGTTHPP